MGPDLYIGLMSGTSADGIDAVLAEFRDETCRVLHHAHSAYPGDLRPRLQAAAEAPENVDLPLLAELDERVARCFADAALALLRYAGMAADQVAAIGSHGQTLLHLPDADPPRTVQIGNPGAIAAFTGIRVVGDFRRADVALGGQGAPLVPGFHAAVFRDPQRGVVVANIGGIANVTLLPAAGGVTGFDTGPGNVLLDSWCQLHRQQPFDDAGRWAAGGRLLPALLAQLEADPFFRRPPPKSTGVDHFNLGWLRSQLAAAGPAADPRDVQATLASFTARSIAHGARRLTDLQRVVVSGGGARNLDLLARLRRELPGTTVESSAERGLPPDQVEAAAVAWLARERLREAPSNLPAVTGAHRAISLGGVWLPPAAL